MGTATAQAEGMALTTVDNSPSGLIRHAIDSGHVDIDVIERLVALQERVMERDARAAFFDALHGFQEEVPEIHKSRTAEIATNSGGRYSYTYAPLEEITRTIRPILKRHGLAYGWDTDGMGDSTLNVVCVLRHRDGHEVRASFPVPTGTSAKMSDAQKNGAALTYGRRQSLIAVLGLTAADDTDAPSQGSDEKISDTQLADLSALVEEVGADLARFCTYLGVDSLSDLRASRYTEAVRELEEKRRRA